MALANKTYRVFISSTFSDLKAERNALQERVFPRLRALCQQHGARFQPIDLRWGVSEEASLDQQAMAICLGEIKRCQEISPRPNFIVLLGDRYGWCPPPSHIPANEFQEILGVIKNQDDLTLLRHWYRQDENAKPPEWCLNPRLKGEKYEKYEIWQPVESRLQAILAEAAGKLNFSPDRLLPYTSSATEQEIAAGALRVKEAAEHVFCFFRNLDGLPKQFNTSEFLTLVKSRLEYNFPAGLSQTSQEFVNKILKNGDLHSARGFADHIKNILETIPKATPEEEVMSFVRQVLVDFTAKDFQNLDEVDWLVDEKAHIKQRNLKARLQQYVPHNINSYSAHWTHDSVTGDMITTAHVDQLCDDVYNALSGVILAEIVHPHSIAVEDEIIRIKLDPTLDAEGLAHRKFAQDHLRIFVGRQDILAEIADGLSGNGNRSLMIVGAGGTGKSTLMARVIQETQKSHPSAELVYRFIGVTPGSSDGRSLLDSLCHELSRRYGADQGNIPTDYRDLVPELGKRMALATTEKPLILFLDSLDQLSESQNARSLIWLPAELPANVFVIVSTRPDDTHKAMQAKQAFEMNLAGLSRQEGENLLSQWLASDQRTLQTDQFKEIMDKFECLGAPKDVELSPGNPLYLKLAFEEARLWASYSPREELAFGVKGIIEKNMIHRMKSEGNHGVAMVSRLLGYLAASRYGLAEDELVDLLSRDLQVYDWFFNMTYHLPSDLVQNAINYRRSLEGGAEKGEEEATKEEERAALAWLKEIRIPPEQEKGEGEATKEEERSAIAWLKEIRTPPEQVVKFLQAVLPKPDGPRLPIVLWSRLSFDLAPYLTERKVDGSSLLNFYHRELGDVSTAVFLGEHKDIVYHARLADYFRAKADPQGDRTWAGNYIHGLSELPYHLTQAELYEEVFQTLTDFKFLEHKAAEVGVLVRTDEKGNPANTYTGVLQLQEDYERALQVMPGGEGGMGDRAPLILTALDTSKGLMVYCPVCNKHSPVTKEMLDTVIQCPQETCKAPIKLNPFTVKREI